MNKNIDPKSMHLPDGSDIMPIINWFSEQMPGGFFVYRADDSQELLYANQATIQLFGCATKEEFRELTGCTFRGLVHPEDWSFVQTTIDSQIADERNDSQMDFVEYRIIQKDGSIRWVEDYGHYATLPGYGAVYYVFLKDITEKRQIQSENKLAAEVIEGLSVDYSCIYLLNLETGNLCAYHLKNDLFREISRKIGIPEGQTANWSEVLQAYAKEYIIPEDQETFLAEISNGRLLERIASEDSFTVNYRCHSQNGGIVYVSMTVNRVARDGNSAHAVLGYRDVTKETLAFQKELSEKMEMEFELEREKHANEIKSQFLFNVSHDIRTPMNAIMGYAGLAKRHIGEPDQSKDYLEKVEEAGSQLLSLIDDLLEM
ncbi:MAG: PAS domain-containing protein, partial [Lachnospiraceae bacterium]|nr:PAS domain-containing protein [Lachnospiraceae bacterium]